MTKRKAVRRFAFVVSIEAPRGQWSARAIEGAVRGTLKVIPLVGKVSVRPIREA